MCFFLMAYLYGSILWAGAGHAVSASRGIFGGICVFIAFLGNRMGKVRRNFFIGIRTPWTLGNERVSNATHRVAGKWPAACWGWCWCCPACSGN